MLRRFWAFVYRHRLKRSVVASRSARSTDVPPRRFPKAANLARHTAPRRPCGAGAGSPPRLATYLDCCSQKLTPHHRGRPQRAGHLQVAWSDVEIGIRGLRFFKVLNFIIVPREKRGVQYITLQPLFFIFKIYLGLVILSSFTNRCVVYPLHPLASSWGTALHRDPRDIRDDGVRALSRQSQTHAPKTQRRTTPC